jgi:ribosomal protein L11 methyltransferase
MQNKKWFALEITADFAASEAVEFALNELDASGTEINNLGKNQPETLTVIGYFNEQTPDEIVQNALIYALEIYGFSAGAVKNLAWREVENRDWLAEWKKHWRPTETAKFIIAPVWESLGNTDKIIIRIEPSMAFGTGTHETTRLCLRAIEENYRSAMSFLDVGTGTGILAVSAAKIQGKSKKAKGKILGCDTDEDSIKIARENAEINKTESIEFYVGSISAETEVFDFVCANLTADVILPILALLVEKSGKFLVLSGILNEQKNRIAAGLEKLRITNYQTEIEGEWISMLIKTEARA